MVDDPQLEDELYSSRMDLYEHLEELRSRIIRSLIGFGVAVIFCLLYQDQIMQIITGPHREAMKKVEEKIAEKREKPEKGKLTKNEKLREEIESLRKTSPEVAAIIEKLAFDINDFKNETKHRRTTLQVIKYQEAFISYLKACFVAALVLSSPWIIFQLWSFISAGLYRHEKKYLIIYLPFSFAAFAAGVVFGYLILIPEGLTYLATYANPDVISVQVTLGFYLSFFLLLTVALGFVFQLPLVMMFLSKTGLVTPRYYAKHRKYAILIAVIVGAVLTPPDPVTQLLLASPVIVLYELGIWLSRMAGGGRKEARA